MALYGGFSSLPQTTKMLWEQFLNFRKRRGQESDANVEFEMQCARCSQMACYLNISGPALKGFKDAL